MKLLKELNERRSDFRKDVDYFLDLEKRRKEKEQKAKSDVAGEFEIRMKSKRTEGPEKGDVIEIGQRRWFVVGPKSGKLVIKSKDKEISVPIGASYKQTGETVLGKKIWKPEKS